MNRREFRRKLCGAAVIVIFLLFSALVFWFIGRPMIALVENPELFRQWVDTHGIWGRLIFIGMVVLQMAIALIPGEPLEIGAGYAFGAPEGTLLCLVGIFIGSALIFGFVRTFGVRVVEIFYSREKILSMKFLQNTRRLNTITFLLMLIPGTPKDLLSYFVGLTEMKLTTWLLISVCARIPSVLSSTVSGGALGEKNYPLAAIALTATTVTSLIGLLIYRMIHRKNASSSDEAN